MDKKTIAYSLARSGLGAIPFGGQAAIEIFEKLVAPPMTKRRLFWEKKIGERLHKLESEGKIDLDALSQNDIFINILFQASLIAMRNNQKERLEALENAVINAALPNSPDEIFQELFLNLVDSVSILHVSMLKKISGVILNVKDIDKLLKETFPEMEQNQTLYQHVWQDLIAKNLISIRTDNHLGYTITRTPLGNRFLDFISENTK